jgi:hypothetical protein
MSVDNAARALAISAKTIAGTAQSGTRRANNRIASRAISGKPSVVALTSAALTPSNVSCATTGVTYNIRVAAPAQFDAVRILVANAASSAVTGVRAAFSLATGSGGWQAGLPGSGGNVTAAIGSNPGNQTVAPSTKGGFLNIGGSAGAYTFNRMTFGYKIEADLPPAIVTSPTAVPSWTVSDWSPCAPVARTDGGTLPLVDIRLQFPPSGYTPISGATSSSPGVTLVAGSMGNWAIDGAIDSGRPFNAGLMWRVLGQNDTGVDKTINFQGSNTPSVVLNGPLIIVQFHTLTDIHTIVYLQDSIGEYNATGEYANTYAFRGAMAAAAATGKTISWCPLTWPSGAAAQYMLSATPIMDYLQPEIVWAKPMGPNDTAYATLTQDNVSTAYSNLGYAMSLAQKYKSKVIIEPHLAVNNSAPDTWGATDSFRIAWNSYYASQAASMGYTFINTDAPWVSGGSIVSGQQQANSSYTADGTHANEAGHTALTPVATAGATAVLNSP